MLDRVQHIGEALRSLYRTDLAHESDHPILGAEVKPCSGRLAAAAQTRTRP
jgi:hypothetical protein